MARMVWWIAVIAVLTCGLIVSACSEQSTESADGDASQDGDVVDGDQGGDLDQDMDVESDSDDDSDLEMDFESDEELETNPSNNALVFEINPVTTPNPVTVSLAAADDRDGVLISPADDEGLRRLAVYSCVDEGATNTINIGNGPQTQCICTLRQRANKIQNGDYVYEDFTDAVEGVFDPDDVHAEVEAFYHASRFYDFFTRPEIGLFDLIPGRHGEDKAPINLVVNYRLPVPSDSASLQATSTAMYFPREHLSVGMGAIYGLIGIAGDIITLGQGPSADFAYDGETMYHEMGHLMNRALVGLGYSISVDSYGMSALENALEQGLAETMTSLVSGEAQLFDYIDTFAGPGFSRTAENTFVYPDDYRGIDQADAMILAGAMWDVFVYLESQGLTDAQNTRLLLLAMQSLDASQAELDFSDWAVAFLDVLDSEGFSPQVAAVGELFNARGLMRTERARSLIPDADGFGLFVGGAYVAQWNSVLTIERDSGDWKVSTALIQLKTGPLNQSITCHIHATPLAFPDSRGMYPQPDDWELYLLLREDAPVEYTLTGTWRATVAYTEQIAAETDSEGGVTFELNTEADHVYYLHVVNAGDSRMLLSDIRLSCP